MHVYVLAGEYGLSEYDANVLVGDLELARFFEEAAQGTASGKKIANWVINNISAVLNEKGMRPSECPVKPGAIRDLIAIIDDGTVSNNQGKDVFTRMWGSNRFPSCLTGSVFWTITTCAVCSISASAHSSVTAPRESCLTR